MPQKVTSIRIDEDLWREAKIFAIQRGITLSDLVESSLKKEMGHGE